MSSGDSARPSLNTIRKRVEVVEMSIKATLRENEVSCGYDPTTVSYRYPQWLLNDELEQYDRFPDLSKTSGTLRHVETTARIIALGLFEKYLDLYSNPFVRTSIFAASFYIVEHRLDTKLSSERECWAHISAEDILNEAFVHRPSGLACCQWGLIIAYMAKLAWFRSGHHLGGVSLDGPLVEGIRAYFRVEGKLPQYVLQAIWHFAHLLDTRVACAHLGIIEMFDGCPPLDKDLELPTAMLQRAKEVFPWGTAIASAGNEVFILLSKSALAKYYKDLGTAGRIAAAYKRVRSSRAAFHPCAHILGQTPKQIDLSFDDFVVVSAIAHVLIPPDVVCRWSDILPLHDVQDEPNFRYLNHVQTLIKAGKPPPAPYSRPFVYKG